MEAQKKKTKFATWRMEREKKRAWWEERGMDVQRKEIRGRGGKGRQERKRKGSEGEGNEGEGE
jgi:hypothetical protein